MIKRKFILIMLGVLMFSAALMIGCQSDVELPVDDCHEVILYYNGGKITNFTYGTYYVEDCARLPLPSDNSVHINTPSQVGNNFRTWYQVPRELLKERQEYKYTYVNRDGELVRELVLDANKDPVSEKIYYVEGHDFLDTSLEYPEYPLGLTDIDENNPIFIQGRPWNFELDKVTADIALVAIWESQRKYTFLPPEYRYADPNAENFEEATGLVLQTASPNGTILKPTVGDPMLPQRNGYKVEGYYLDRQCQIEVPFDRYDRYLLPAAEKVEGSEEPAVFKIYVKWLEDKYEIIHEASELGGGFGDSYYYIKRDLDFDGGKLTSLETFTKEIRGNNHTISNFVVDIKQDEWKQVGAPPPIVYGGIFKKLQGAKISNLTFNDFDVRFNYVEPTALLQQSHFREQTINVFAESISDNCSIRNVRLENGSYCMVPYTDFNVFFFDKYDEKGNCFYMAQNGDEIAPEYSEGGELVYPDDADYMLDEYGERVIYKFLQDVSGRILYGYKAFDPPKDAYEIVWAQTGKDGDGEPEDNFGIKSNTVLGCSAEVEKSDWLPNWRFWVTAQNYKQLPASLNAVSSRTFYGWYNIRGERLNVNVVPVLDEHYYAMWM